MADLIESVHVGSGGLGTSINPLLADENTNYRLTNMIADLPGWAIKRMGVSRLSQSTFASVLTGANTSNFVPKAMWCHDDHVFAYLEYIAGGTSAAGYKSAIVSYDLVSGQGWHKVVESASHLCVDNTRFKMRSCAVDRRQLIPTSTGIKRIAAIGKQYYPDGSTSSVNYSTMYRPAGIPRALDPRCRNSVSGGASDHGLIAATGFEWLPVTSAVSYRICWIRRDENGILQSGMPSGRIVVRNTSTTTAYATRLKVAIPSGVSDTSNVMQVFRTNVISKDGTGIIPDPGDDQFLAGEYRLTSTDISNGYVLYDDVSFDGLLGSALYTNENQEGPLAGRAQPPVSSDVASFGGSAFYSNVTEKQRMTIKLLAVDSSGIGTYKGITVGDKIVAGDLVMTAVASADEETNGWNFVADSTTGTGSEVIRAIKTAESFCYKYNIWSNSKNGRYAAYNMTSNDDVFGVIMLEEKDVGGSTGCYVGVSRVDSPVQILPAPVFTSTPGNTLAIACAVATDVGPTTVTVTTASSHNLTTGDLVFLAPFAASVESGASSPRFANTDVPAGVYQATVTSSTTFTFAAPSGSASNQTDSRAATTGGYVHKIYDTTSSVWTEARSENPIRKNRLMWSPYGEPESAPIANYVDIGSSASAILRIVPTITSLFVFKEDGTWRLQGDAGEWSISELDRSCVLVGPETPAVLGGRIICMTSTGVMSVDESGAEDISGDMKSDFSVALRSTMEEPQYAAGQIGVANEDESSYTMFIRFSSSNDSTNFYNAIRYHSPTRTWSNQMYTGDSLVLSSITAACNVRATRPVSGVLMYANRLAMAFEWTNVTGSYFAIERRHANMMDLCDWELPISITSIDTSTNSIAITYSGISNISQIEVGDLVVNTSTGWPLSNFADTKVAQITAVNSFASSLTLAISGAVASLSTWSTGSAIVLKKIKSQVAFRHDISGFDSKRSSEIELSLGNWGQVSSVSFGFYTNPTTYSSPTTATKSGYAYEEWNPTNGRPWNSSYRSSIRILRCGVPREAAMNSFLGIIITNDRAMEAFDVAGIRLLGVPGSHKTGRTNA